MSLRNVNKGKLTTTPDNRPSAKGSLRKAASGQIARPDGKGLAAVRKASMHMTNSGAANIGIIIDATGSRRGNWEEAQSIQRDMFREIARMRLRLVHYGGHKVTDHGWKDDAEEVANIMAEVSCAMGGTQILESFERFLDSDSAHDTGSVIMIGDSFEEEDPDEMARRLKDRGIPVYAFHEGDNADAAMQFQKIAEITGGKFAKFGPDMPLSDLCKGVALMTYGGESALSRLENAAARQLLSGPGGAG